MEVTLQAIIKILLILFAVVVVSNSQYYSVVVHLPIAVNNPTNMLASGSCCNASETQCTTCGLRVALCFRPPDHDQNDRQESSCLTEVISLAANVGSSTLSPRVLRKFSERLQLYVRIFHRIAGIGSFDSPLIDEVIDTSTYTVGQVKQLTNLQGEHGVATVSVTLQVVCSGPDCTPATTSETITTVTDSTSTQLATTDTTSETTTTDSTSIPATTDITRITDSTTGTTTTIDATSETTVIVATDGISTTLVNVLAGTTTIDSNIMSQQCSTGLGFNEGIGVGVLIGSLATAIITVVVLLICYHYCHSKPKPGHYTGTEEIQMAVNPVYQLRPDKKTRPATPDSQVYEEV